MTALLDEGVATFASVQATLPMGAPLQVGTAAFTATQAAVATALATISANLTTADTEALLFLPGVMPIIVGVTPLGGGTSIPASSNPTSTAAALLMLLETVQDLAGLVNMNGYINRIAANLSNASA